MSLPIRRQSRELISDLRSAVGAKRIANQVDLAEVTIHKWCEDAGKDAELPFEPSGRKNPFDRTAELLHMMVVEGLDDLAIESINWLAREIRGLYLSEDQLNQFKKILFDVERQADPQAQRRTTKK